MFHRIIRQFLDYFLFTLLNPVPLTSQGAINKVYTFKFSCRNEPQQVHSTGLAEFSERSLQALTIRLSEFEIFLKIVKIRSVKTISYRHLIDFVADYGKSLYPR